MSDDLPDFLVDETTARHSTTKSDSVHNNSRSSSCAPRSEKSASKEAINEAESKPGTTNDNAYEKDNVVTDSNSEVDNASQTRHSSNYDSHLHATTKKGQSEIQPKNRNNEDDRKGAIEDTANSLYAQALSIRARHLEAISKSRRPSQVGTTSHQKNQSTVASISKATLIKEGSPVKRIDHYHVQSQPNKEGDFLLSMSSEKINSTIPKPKYSYLSPEHLLKHEQELNEARLQAKRDRHRNEQIRLRNLAIARERENMEKMKNYEDNQTHFSVAAMNATRDGPDPPVHDLNVTTTRNEAIRGKLWFPTGKHGGRGSQHKPPLGYGALPPPSWMVHPMGVDGSWFLNSSSTTSKNGRTTSPLSKDTSNNNNSSYSRRMKLSPLRPFDETLFEDVTKEHEAKRVQAEHDEKWAHIRLIQQKRSESVKTIEERKRQHQLAIERQLQQDVVAAQADKDRKKEQDQQFAFSMRNLDRERRQKIAAYKEQRAKAVLQNALDLRMQALKRAEDQEKYDRQVKKEERSAADMQRAAYLLALQEERDKHDAQLAREAALRAEIESRTSQYNFNEEQKRKKLLEAKLERVDRQIVDKLKYREQVYLATKEKQFETDHMYSTLLKPKRTRISDAKNNGSSHLSSKLTNSSGCEENEDLLNADRKNESLVNYYHTKA